MRSQRALFNLEKLLLNKKNRLKFFAVKKSPEFKRKLNDVIVKYYVNKSYFGHYQNAGL
jgi:hypothetical protein